MGESTRKETFLGKYIDNGNVNISSGDFASINEEYTKDEVKDAFVVEVLENHSIDLPTREINERDAKEDFLALCEYQTGGLHTGETFSRYEYSQKMDYAYFWETTVGMEASDYFHQDARFKAASQSEMSPYAVWHNERSLRSALNPLWSLGMDKVNRSVLRSCISLRKYIAAQFRPAIAKAVYEYFNASDVLDFSAGWGDRLAGFYAASCTKSYLGVDPNTLVFQNYQRQADFYAELVGKKDCRFVQSPAEDMKYEKESVDLVFTSPPYFIAERYTYGVKDATQSSIRHKGLDEWVGGFLEPAVANAWAALRKGGHLVINVSDMYAKSGKGNYHARYCDRMHDFIVGKLGGDFVRMVGMKMHKRPNCHSIEKKTFSKDASFCEPVWVYRKHGD